jgi:hypothetical protein
MSAYIVHTDQIDLIVTAAVTGVPHDRDLAVWNHRTSSRHSWSLVDADELGQLLIAANVESVNYRYNESTPVPAYKFRQVSSLNSMLATWGDVLRAIDCFEYQACEVPDYHLSLAHIAIDGIRRKVVDRMVSFHYPDTDWSWTRDKANERREAFRQALYTVGQEGK